jgi:hypothetical protein
MKMRTRREVCSSQFLRRCELVRLRLQVVTFAAVRLCCWSSDEFLAALSLGLG